MLKNSILPTLFKSSLVSVISLYGIWYLLLEIFYSYLPFGMFLVCTLAGAGYFLRVPPPAPQQVEAIIGKDLHVEINEKSIRTVAHRGAGLDAPENTLEAFKMCKEKGCRAIEFDVTLTSDNVPVIFHDKTLERVADSTLVINNNKYEDLSKIDLSVKHPYRDRFVKTNIPTLDQTVTLLLSSGQKMFIDIKDNNLKMVPVILNLFEKYPELLRNAVVSSFFPNIIYMIRRNNPNIVCSLAWRPNAFACESYKYPEGPGARRSKSIFKHCLLTVCDAIHEWALPRITYYMLGISVVLLHKDSVSGETIVNWREKGIRVMAWTVNSPCEKQHFARTLKVTYLTDTLTGENTTYIPAN